MDIYRAERAAQDMMARDPKWDKKFILIGPGGLINCEWIDPYFGIFSIEGKEGFAMSKQVPSNVEVIMPQPDSQGETADD
ncbi:hypothetical protein GA0061099_102145 [Bradyrhizobium yuanmingense]|uniref:Uncharacterized protein n=1 Tax=Bradyrhizobium yuanmingense TaxID=108015 RepID=A0A1C3XHL8_9BRAD|nr:hypothetical protein [Bradyrhizobium yuanmingense]TWI18948.1 hypothetical protein IQ15_06972 [Bradyrhizobium yuanmingense]SCB51772.1 hypothetical protein GA0061099_102145 [Bradyrhizobium yuanmingense]